MEDHLKKDYSEMKMMYIDKERYTTSEQAFVIQDDYESDDAITISDKHSFEKWILNSDYSYHMIPTRIDLSNNL